MLHMGVGRVAITPKLGTRLAGYPNRPNGAERVLDELYARALVLRSGSQSVCVVSIDVMAVDEHFVADLRRDVSERHGIAPDHVLVAATHTHSSMAGLLSYDGPHGGRLAALFMEGDGGYSASLAGQLRAQVLQAVGLAEASMTPARAGIATAHAEGIASNRVNAAQDVDDVATVVLFTSLAGDPLGALLHFACHPTTLGAGDLSISADFPGLACDAVERALGPGVVAAYLNGALGDKSTRYTRREFGYAEVERFAGRLTDAFLEAVSAIDEWTDDLDLFATEAPVDMAARRPSHVAPETVAELKSALAKIENEGGSASRRREIEIALQGATMAVTWESLGESGPGTLTCSMQRVSLAPLAQIIAIPGEPFSRIGERISDLTRDERVLVVAPANGYLGYFVDEQSLDAAPYESNATLADRGADDVLVGAAARLLGRVDAHPQQSDKGE